MLLNILMNLKEGYSEGYYNSRKYGLTKTTFNKGKSIKFYAEELGGVDFVRLNYYVTKTQELLKPCEMPKQKVIHFLNNVKIYQSE